MPITCPKCAQEFRYQSDLARHAARRTPCDAPKPVGLACPHCAAAFSTTHNVARHIKTGCRLAPGREGPAPAPEPAQPAPPPPAPEPAADVHLFGEEDLSHITAEQVRAILWDAAPPSSATPKHPQGRAALASAAQLVWVQLFELAFCSLDRPENITAWVSNAKSSHTAQVSAAAGWVSRPMPLVVQALAKTLRALLDRTQPAGDEDVQRLGDLVAQTLHGDAFLTPACVRSYLHGNCMALEGLGRLSRRGPAVPLRVLAAKLEAAASTPETMTPRSQGSATASGPSSVDPGAPGWVPPGAVAAPPPEEATVREALEGDYATDSEPDEAPPPKKAPPREAPDDLEIEWTQPPGALGIEGGWGKIRSACGTSTGQPDPVRATRAVPGWHLSDEARQADAEKLAAIRAEAERAGERDAAREHGEEV